MGLFVARMFGKRTAVGRITKWVPADGEDGALFLVDYLVCVRLYVFHHGMHHVMHYGIAL